MTLILPQPTDTTKSKSHSKLHRVFAIDSGASDQTVVANANNSITVNSTVLANSFVGNLVGNASTVTNGVYKNTNNTLTGTNTFTGSVVVPDATTDTNPVTLGQFPSLLDINGWVELPNGLILQWCQGVNQIDDQSQTVTFPKEFPTICLSVTASTLLPNAGNNSNLIFQIKSWSKSSVDVYGQGLPDSDKQGKPLIWAVGY